MFISYIFIYKLKNDKHTHQG